MGDMLFIMDTDLPLKLAHSKSNCAKKERYKCDSNGVCVSEYYRALKSERMMLLRDKYNCHRVFIYIYPNIVVEFRNEESRRIMSLQWK